jgi:hypothetical protein
LGGDVVAFVTPHFDLPFRFEGYTEQGTVKDLANCTFLIVLTPLGWRDEAPSFGIPDLAFGTPPVMRERVRTAISEQEPRAEMLFAESGTNVDLERIVSIALEARGS